MKFCSKCNSILLIENFGKNIRSKDKLAAYCRNCMKKSVRDWQKRNPDKRRQYQRTYLENHREYLNGKRRERLKSNPRHRKYVAKLARNSRLKKYGLTEKSFEEKLEKQKSVCSICCSYISPTSAVIDHCHESGVTRDLLCNPCNMSLGHIERGDFLKKALAYIARHRSGN